MNKKLVSFFIAGAPKAGTTSLYFYLDSHPGICLSKIKEPNFFSSTELKKQKLYYQEEIIDNEAEYNSLFTDCKENALLGEASVSYLYYASTAQKIVEYNPDAKIIVLLRDPSLRAFSHWLMDERLGYVNFSLEKIIASSESHLQFFQQYILLGQYAKQLSRYYTLFKKEQILLIFQEDMRNNLENVLKDLFSFLQVDDFIVPMNEEHNTARKIKNPLLARLYTSRELRRIIKIILPSFLSSSLLKTVTEPDDRKPSKELLRTLYQFYKDDITSLEKISGRDLSHWRYL